MNAKDDRIATPPHRVLGREAKHLPRRFYREVTVAPRAGLYAVLLDGRPARTPGKALLGCAGRPLVDALAAEWAAQKHVIDPATMPLTRLMNTAIDHVPARMAEVRADIVRYAGSDLICYRAEAPQELAARQKEIWDPVLAWLEGTLGVRLALTHGVMPISQSPASLAAIARALEAHGAIVLTVMHVTTTLLGSAALALAQAHAFLDGEAAWSAAHIDEDWQIARWGSDGEARARRRFRHAEFASALKLHELSGETRIRVGN